MFMHVKNNPLVQFNGSAAVKAALMDSHLSCLGFLYECDLNIEADNVHFI